jgi:hypothetical protein
VAARRGDGPTLHAAALAAPRRSFLTAVTWHAAVGELLAGYRALRLATERSVFAAAA